MSTPTRDTMFQPDSELPAASTPNASEEPAILALPVELQKTIVEYVSTGDVVLMGRCKVN